ncbi:adenosine deaminase [Intestinibacillus massiliensis]|nr:adenosine deaminase [Intestinibacillus massiliensis]
MHHPYAKTDLHLHLDGSLRMETILTLAARQGVALPADTPDGLTPYCMVPPGCHSLAEYLACFDLPLSVLQTADALRYAASELVITLGMQGLTCAEIRFAPQLHGQRGLAQAGAVEAVLAGVQDGRRRYPFLKAGVILCMMTTGSDADNAETVRLALAYRDKGVCAVDLAGQEDARPMQEYAGLLAPARDAGLPITLHAGEAGTYRNVALAVKLGARRIGHGTHAANAPKLLRQLVAQGIVLEQCVTSNVQTQCVGSYQSHPIRRLFDAGVKIAVCTDNMTVSGTTLAREYQILRDVHGFTDDELAVLARYAREASFVA